MEKDNFKEKPMVSDDKIQLATDIYLGKKFIDPRDGLCWTRDEAIREGMFERLKLYTDFSSGIIPPRFTPTIDENASPKVKEEVAKIQAFHKALESGETTLTEAQAVQVLARVNGKIASNYMGTGSRVGEDIYRNDIDAPALTEYKWDLRRNMGMGMGPDNVYEAMREQSQISGEPVSNPEFDACVYNFNKFMVENVMEEGLSRGFSARVESKMAEALPMIKEYQEKLSEYAKEQYSKLRDMRKSKSQEQPPQSNS
jgi:hypothetical protein